MERKSASFEGTSLGATDRTGGAVALERKSASFEGTSLGATDPVFGGVAYERNWLLDMIGWLRVMADDAMVHDARF